MASSYKTRLLRRIALAVAVVAFPVMLSAADRSGDRRAAKPGEEVEMFAGMEKGDIEVQLIPKDSTQCNVLIKNKTARPLSIKLPDAFAAVPVLAQLGGPGGGFGGAGGGQRGGGTRSSGGGTSGNRGGGGGQQSMGGGMGGMGGGMMGGMGGGMGMFNIPPEKEAKLKVPTVCLEHGKREPQPSMKYEIKPIEQFTDKPAVKEICTMLGRGHLNQRVAQVAAWHLSNDMSWDELAAKRIRLAPSLTRPYFSAEEIQAAIRAVTVAALAVEQSKSSGESTSASQNSSASRN